MTQSSQLSYLKLNTSDWKFSYEENRINDCLRCECIKLQSWAQAVSKETGSWHDTFHPCTQYNTETLSVGRMKASFIVQLKRNCLSKTLSILIRMREQLIHNPIHRCESDVLNFNATEFPYPLQPSATVCCFLKLIVIPRCSFVIFICWILNVNMLSVIEQGNKTIVCESRASQNTLTILWQRRIIDENFLSQTVHPWVNIFRDSSPWFSASSFTRQLSYASWQKIIIWMGKIYFFINIETQKTQKCWKL